MQRGFSLVELSIVLVILGLLTGGILAGQSLIRAAELRTVTTDLQKYQTAIRSFQDKYMALPGDMTNATRFWGVRAVGTNIACQQTINSYDGTCNSDGNGQIDYIAGDISLGERFLAWQHLALAGLIEGSYTGASGSTTSGAHLRGVNTPPSRLGDAFFSLSHITSPQSGHANWFDGNYGFNTLWLAGVSGRALRPDELWSIDNKLDDGKPATGYVFTVKSTGSYAPGCTTTDVASTSEYAVTSNSKLCTGYFVLR